MLILTDVIFIPHYSYMACAWAGFAAYGISMVASYIFGQKYYPINYPVKDIMTYVALAVLVFAGMTCSNQLLPSGWALVGNTLLLLAFVAYMVKKDIPLASLPVIGKHFKK